MDDIMGPTILPSEPVDPRNNVLTMPGVTAPPPSATPQHSECGCKSKRSVLGLPMPTAPVAFVIGVGITYWYMSATAPSAA